MAKTKLIAKLNCQESAAKVIRQVLQARMKKMCSLRQHALDWSDPEGVHDMRVASRRLRSALSDFKPYLRKGSMPIGRLKAIAKSLGAVRDQDVVLAALDELRSKVDEKVSAGIDAIAEGHRRQRQQARSSLDHAIRTSAIAELRDDFNTRLQIATKSPHHPSGEEHANAAVSFGQLGAKIIGNRLTQLSGARDSIYRPARTKQLHKMRILAKRLRYAVELFAPCWGDQLDQSAKEIARLQTSLGELHDCDVWIANLGALLTKDHESNHRGRNDLQENEAVVWLLQHFVNERTKHYCAALARWQQWEQEGFLDQLKAMLKADIAPTPTELSRNDFKSRASKATGKIHTRKLVSSSRQ